VEDHLSKALERAQEEKASVRDWVRPQNDGDRISPQRAHSLASPSGLAAQAIQVDLDPEHLLSRNVLAGAEHDDPMITDRYRLLRTRIKQRMEPRGWNTLGITSPSSKEGKSLNSLNVAITASRDTEKPVILIDADLRRPSVAKYTGLAPEHGLIDYLAGEVDISQVLFQAKSEPGFFMIPSRLVNNVAPPSESLASQRMTDLLDQFVKQGFMVIVDLPPVMVADDVLSLAPKLDALLLVIRDGQTNSKDLKESTALLADFNLLGTVLNDSEEQSGGTYGYYYAGN